MEEVDLKTPEKSSVEPDADRFRVGDIWESPRGVRHKVFRVAMRVAHMINLNTQRTANRAYDDIGVGGKRPWVRISSGNSGVDNGQ